MKKRGKVFPIGKKADTTHELYFAIIQVLIALFVLGVMLAYVDSIKDDSSFEKVYLSKDFALLVNVVYAAPGEVFYQYYSENIDLSKYFFNLKNQKASVEEAKEGEILSGQHPYGEDLSYSVKNPTVSGKKQFTIFKTDKEFGLDKPAAGSLEKNE